MEISKKILIMSITMKDFLWIILVKLNCQIIFPFRTLSVHQWFQLPDLRTLSVPSRFLNWAKSTSQCFHNYQLSILTWILLMELEKITRKMFQSQRYLIWDQTLVITLTWITTWIRSQVQCFQVTIQKNKASVSVKR